MVIHKMGILEKFSNYWDSRLDEEAIKRISAALGSLLLLILAALSIPLNEIIGHFLGGAWALFFVIIWGGVVSYLGTFIVTVFGTTKQALEVDDELAEEIADAIDEAEDDVEEELIDLEDS